MKTNTPPQQATPAGIQVCPRHDFDIVAEPQAGCPKCNDERATPAASPIVAAQQAAPEWDRRLPDTLERSLKDLYLETPPEVVAAHAHQVRSAFQAICTDRATLRHMLTAMQAKVSIDEGGTATPAASTIAAAQPDVWEALALAEAALADIGDADREPGDDLAWCERRAAQDLDTIRAALATRGA